MIDDSLRVAGYGRSYGDVGLNTGHALLLTRGLDRYIGFDGGTGLLECEYGVQLADIIRDFLPRGWFLPVVPGTRYVSVGGAIAKVMGHISQSGQGSFLAVLKTFGNRTLALFRDLDALVLAAGGALYPALDDFKPFIDPAFSSTFWRSLVATGD
jgi:hypothetical protein